MNNPADRTRYAAWAELDAVVAQMSPEFRDEMLFVLDDPDRCTLLSYEYIDYRREVGSEGKSARLTAGDLREARVALDKIEKQFRTVRDVVAKLKRLQVPAENQSRDDLYLPIAELDSMAWTAEKSVMAMGLPRMMNLLDGIVAALPSGCGVGPGDALQGTARNRFVLEVAYTLDRLGVELLPKGTFGEFIFRSVLAAEKQELKTSALYDLAGRARRAVDSMSPILSP